MESGTRLWDDAARLADEVIAATSGDIRLAMPLGLGKPNNFVNALYQKVRSDNGLSLTIFTALTLERPDSKNALQKRFLEPLNERLFDGYTDLDYARDLRAGRLPDNINVMEFYLSPGRWLGHAAAQQNYVSMSYTDVVDQLARDGINVIAQMIAPPDEGADERANLQYSLSSNPDLTLDLLNYRERGELDFLVIGEVNSRLPYMFGDAAVSAANFDHILDGPLREATLFNMPKGPVSLSDYAAGFHAARLIPDGGTLQIGIGSIGDAIARALIMRHRDNENFRALVDQLEPDTAPPLACDGGPFREGLYGVSEMMVDTFLDLIDAGVVAREVDGCLIHAGFFVGPTSLYERLKDMPAQQRRKIGMTRISFVNDVHHDFEKKQRDRKDARFINNAMKATLLGAVVSDGLENGQVVSGVGGQFDFVRQAFALKGARSVILVNAVRDSDTGPESNIVWEYGHHTIPRHMRDIIITEYGIADVRGKSDAEIIKSMLSITDSRFHGELIDKAKTAGKLPGDFLAPESWKMNNPGRIKALLCEAHDEGLLDEFPFGTDFTSTERQLLPVLDRLKQASGSKRALFRLALKGLFSRRLDQAGTDMLDRMGLRMPESAKERFLAALMRGAFHN